MRTSVLLAALAAAAILTPLAALSLRLSGAVTQEQRREIVVGIDYQRVSSITVTATRSGQKLLFTAENTSAGGVSILVPAEWKRTEVRNVTIDDISVDPPVLGMRRMGIPAGASVSFAGTFAPVLRVHAAGNAPLKITLIAVDLDSNTVHRDVRLAQQSSVALWGE